MARVRLQMVSLDDCSGVSGAVVVIDVLRAFSTAAYAFAAGAKQITLVGTVEQALELKRQMPAALLVGEVGGLPVAGFDLSNSPSEIAGLELSGRELIQRTSAGTQGIVLSRKADLLLGASFCCAQATVRYLDQAGCDQVTFVVSGAHTCDHGDEDAACADYMIALMTGASPDVRPYLNRVRQSCAAMRFLDPGEIDFPLSDLEYCLQVDVVDLALHVDRADGRFLMTAARLPISAERRRSPSLPG